MIYNENNHNNDYMIVVNLYAGLIRKYWSQYKRIEVILAYLQIVHHVSVG